MRRKMRQRRRRNTEEDQEGAKEAEGEKRAKMRKWRMMSIRRSNRMENAIEKKENEDWCDGARKNEKEEQETL